MFIIMNLSHTCANAPCMPCISSSSHIPVRAQNLCTRRYPACAFRELSKNLRLRAHGQAMGTPTAFATVLTRSSRRRLEGAALSRVALRAAARRSPRLYASARPPLQNGQRATLPSKAAKDCAQRVDAILRSLADAQCSAKMEQYIRGICRAYGVLSPARRAAVKNTTREYLSTATIRDVVDLVDALFASGWREAHYTALDVIVQSQRLWATSTPDSVEAAPLFRDCLIRCTHTVPWWDTIDCLSSQGWGPLAQKHPETCRDLLASWIDSNDVWERRVTILFQLRYRSATDDELLFDIVRRRAGDKEFWIRKAIGWALRTRARDEPDVVAKFIDENESILSPLSVREGRKGVLRARQ